MEGAEENREIIDLLRRFTKIRSECPTENKKPSAEEEEEDEDVELGLGLSMNGRFGVDPTRSKKLKRCSSIADVALAKAGPQVRVAGVDLHAPLSRTRSLPAGTEEEWRRRREMLTARRMEARRKRMERMRNLRVPPRDAGGGGRNVPPREAVESSSQGSGGPMRSGSSGSSDLIEGSKQNAEVSPSSSSRQIPKGHEPAGRALEREAKSATCQHVKNTMRDMPYVTTREVGPNGRRVEGFLYGYKKGEDVKIVCVCHGLFFTPKEFLEHGGVRGDVEHPLKHIVVNPFPLL
ncbi:Ninja-family protein AFP3 [Striga asiatica]|uniref:Ninja-family protein n=1 Tax=Striga asiatica TaxID=4170 RepID=A0A5A7QK16_STRAF|nr:Ninja-family protein AFP3 [Striga asiatica]